MSEAGMHTYIDHDATQDRLGEARCLLLDLASTSDKLIMLTESTLESHAQWWWAS